MAEIQETVERKLVRTLRELTAPHAISPEGAAAIKPLVPMAEIVARAAEEHQATVLEMMEAGRRAQDDAATLRGQLAAAHDREEKASEEIAKLQAGVEAATLKAAAMIPPKDGPLRPTADTPVVVTDHEWATIQEIRSNKASALPDEGEKDPEPTPNPDAPLTPAGERLEKAFAEVQAERPAKGDPVPGDCSPTGAAAGGRSRRREK